MIDRAWELFSRLQRQHPFWPSTMTTCSCGRTAARGSDLCALCLRDELAKLVGTEYANETLLRIQKLNEMWNAIYQRLDGEK